MTLTQLQNYIHSLYQGDADYPDSGDEEWTQRLVLILAAIGAWDNEKGILWNELWVTLADAADGDKTTAANTLTYSAPTDFRFPGGFVVTGSGGTRKEWEVVKPERANEFIGTSAAKVYFTGNAKIGYTLHFCTQPTAGETIDYPYYKTPFEPSTEAHIVEMSDPWFIVYFVISKLHEIDGEGDRAIKALQECEGRMMSMRTRNEMPAFLQQNSVPDRDLDTGSGGFGY